LLSRESMRAISAITLVLLAAPLVLRAARVAGMQEPEEEEEVTMIPVEEGDEVTVEAGEVVDVFTVEEGSSAVENANQENPDSGIKALVEIRTKLKFIGNQVGLRNPEMVPTLVGDINDQKDKHPDAKFAFCVHVGTSASENIKTSRPGFMEGRVQSLVDALAEQDLAVDAANAFEHFQSTRFAGLVMKVYTGETAPECTKEDLIPPPASSLVQLAQEPEEEEVTMIPVEEGDEVTVEAVDSADVFTVEAGSTPVEEENKENPDSEVQALVEIRTKLRFIGNQVGLRNPEMVPTLVGDINDQKDKHPEANFAFCVHVGTSASENIKTSRPGFMEGRVQTLVDALAEQGLEVDAANAFEHFQSTRFAGLVMKVYGGDTAPECNKEDLIPPPA